MKPYITLIILIVLASSCFAIPAGSTEVVYTFDQCDSLEVQVGGNLTIEDGEYNFIGCENIGNNTWDCDCYDGYELKINTTPLTRNKYSLNLSYEYAEHSDSSPSGSGGSFTYWYTPSPEKENSTNETKETEPTPEKKDDTKQDEEQSDEQKERHQPTEPKPNKTEESQIIKHNLTINGSVNKSQQPESHNFYFLVGLATIVISLIGLFILLWLSRKKE